MSRSTKGFCHGLRGGREDFADPHALHTLPKGVAVDRVSIAEEVGWRGVVRERLDDLLGGPGRGGMLGHVEVQDAPPMVGEHDQDEEDAQVSGGHGEEVDRDQVADVVGEERAPGLRRRGAPLRDQPGDGALGHVDSELQEFAMDSGGAPQGIGRGHSRDQGADFGVTGGRPTPWAGGRAWSSGRGTVAAASAGRCRAPRSRGPFFQPRPHPGQRRPRRAGRYGAASAGSPSSCTRRAAGAGRGSRGRAGGGRRRGTGRVEAGGAAC